MVGALKISVGSNKSAVKNNDSNVGVIKSKNGADGPGVKTFESM